MAADMRATSRPEWLAAEMPPGYRNRIEELERLTRELEELVRYGRLLCAVGPELADAVREMLVALEFDAVAKGSTIAVSMDGGRRLLLQVSGSDEPLQRRSPELAHAFQIIHQHAGNGDRVALVANPNPTVRPAERREQVDAEAVALLKRLGVNYVAAPTLFALWSLALTDRPRARAAFDRLHAQDGGVFALQIPVGV